MQRGLRIPVLGGAQIIAFCGLIETTGFFQASSTTDGRGPREGQFAMKDSTESAEPGNYGVGFPNFLGKVEDPEARKSKLAAELANGRLAMMAIIGMFFQDGLTGSAWGDWSLYTASPLRARESKVARNFFGGGETTSYASFDPATELGVQDPIGFWDPLGGVAQGLSADKDQATFKRRRAAMYATMGYIVPEYFKFPGYLSPSFGLKFSDVPNGLAALSKIPAIIGMFFQDGLTGSAWGDWSLYTASPLRARESKVARNFFGGGETTSYASFDPATELGVQDPIGFWDPRVAARFVSNSCKLRIRYVIIDLLGLSADKDQATFKRRRAVEIKHGRIAADSSRYKPMNIA
eukprot:s8125_g6.t1